MKTEVLSLMTLAGACQAGLVVNPIYSSQFSTTTFATGLNYPVGMTALPDGSFLVGTTSPDPGSGGVGQFAYYLGSGQVLRFTDANHDGVADGPGTAVVSNLPGAVTAVRALDNGMIVVSTIGNQTGNGFKMADLTFFRVSANGTDPYTNLGSVHFQYQPGGDAASLNPGVQQTQPGQFKIVFGLEALGNDGTPGGPVTLSGLISAQLPAGSVDSLTVDTTGATPVVSNAAELASGIRNTSNPIVDSAGNIYFGDNNYSNDGVNPVNTDELNLIATGTSGVPFYGYPGNYIEYGTGVFVGGLGVPPLAAFQPRNGYGSSGIAGLALSPSAFPAGFENGVFAGFHGSYVQGGVSNTDDPVIYIDASGNYVHFLEAGQAGLSHPDSLLSTSDSLLVANMFTGNFLANTGEIDVITAVTPEPAAAGLTALALVLVLSIQRFSVRRRYLRRSS